MRNRPSSGFHDVRRSPHGERGLKFDVIKQVFVHLRRSPHGERGLKFLVSINQINSCYVAPLTGSVD